MTANMDSATLPTISFEVMGREVNLLAGHKKEMVITAMRDTITPLNSRGFVTVNIQAYEQEISKLLYQVYSLDGTEVLHSGEGTITDGKSEFALEEILDGKEGVLRVELVLEGTVVRVEEHEDYIIYGFQILNICKEITLIG